MSDNLVLIALLFLLTSNSTINSTQLFLLLALLRIRRMDLSPLH